MPSDSMNARVGTRGRVNPIGHAQMRTSNMGLVLRHLHDNGGRSRAVLAAEVGLSKASISSIVSELSERGLVCEGEAARQGRVGRPGIEVAIDGNRVCGVGVEINVDYVVACAVGLAGEVRMTRTAQMPSPPAPKKVLEVLTCLIKATLDEIAGWGMWPAGVIVAPPGVIDYERGVVRFSPNLNWRDVPLVEELESALGASAPPMSMENDAKLSAVAAYAEFGQGETEDLVFLTGDVGVGAGIVSSGRLVRGWSGFSGEVGHMRIHRDGLACSCGRQGCWEMYVGLPVLMASTPAESVARDHEASMVERLAAIRKHLDEQDPGVQAAFDGIVEELGGGVALLVDVLNPKTLVLGGYFGYFADLIVPRLQGMLDRRLLDEGGRLDVVAARRGLDTAAVGGGLIALERVLEDPVCVPRN